MSLHNIKSNTKLTAEMQYSLVFFCVDSLGLLNGYGAAFVNRLS